jgi:two-component system, sensor histidine kinase and response regulator
MIMGPSGQEQTVAAGRPTSCDGSSPQSRARSGQHSGTEGIFDRDAALARVEGDGELLLEILEVFLDDSPRLLMRIREALRRKDLKMLEQAAHTLKGSTGNFCAPAAYEAASRLELIGREGKLEKAREAWVELEKAIQHLRPALMALRDGTA